MADKIEKKQRTSRGIMITKPFNAYKFVQDYERIEPRPEVILPTKRYRAMKDGVIKEFDTKNEALQFSITCEPFRINQEESIQSLDDLNVWETRFNAAINKKRQEYYGLDHIVHDMICKTTEKIDDDKEMVFFELYQLYQLLPNKEIQ